MLPCGSPQLLKLANQNKPCGINPYKQIYTNETLPRHHFPSSPKMEP